MDTEENSNVQEDTTCSPSLHSPTHIREEPVQDKLSNYLSWSYVDICLSSKLSHFIFWCYIVFYLNFILSIVITCNYLYTRASRNSYRLLTKLKVFCPKSFRMSSSMATIRTFVRFANYWKVLWHISSSVITMKDKVQKISRDLVSSKWKTIEILTEWVCLNNETVYKRNSS